MRLTWEGPPVVGWTGLASGVGFWKSTCLVPGGEERQRKAGFRRWFGMGSTCRPPASSVALGSLLFQAELLLNINNTS